MATSSENSAGSQRASASRREGLTIGPLNDDFLRLTPTVNSTGHSLPVSGTHMPHQQRTLPHPAYGNPIGYAPPNTVGRLVMSVVQARLTKNYSMMFKMDPYCRIRLGHQVFETPTAHGGGKEPRWNKTVQCYLPIGCDKIDIEIFDEKSFGDDECVAWTQIDIPPGVYEGNTVDDWFPLDGKSGENGAEGSIHLTLTLHSMAQMPMQPPRLMVAPGMVPGMMPAYMPTMYYPTGTPVPQQPQPPARLYSDDDLKQVREMFQDMDVEVIQSVLEAQGGNVQAAINALLEMNS